MPNDFAQLITLVKEKNDPHSLAERLFGPLHRNKVRCPFHDDSKPSLHVYDDGYHCFACGWHGDIVDLIASLHNCSKREAIDYLAGQQIDTTPRTYDRKIKRRDSAPGIDPAYVKSCKEAMTDQQCVYWERRGISRLDLSRFYIGWNGTRYTIPWHYRGKVIAVKMRRDDELTPNMEPKYISLKGSRFMVPYGIDQIHQYPPKRLLICEDEKSVWIANSQMIDAISCPANSWKREWNELISHVPEVVFVHDNDKAGVSSAQKFLKLFPRGKIIHPPNVYTDTGVHINDLYDAYFYLKDLSWLDE